MQVLDAIAEPCFAVDNSDEISTPHVTQWNRLVSQTNWEKGACILKWRNDLIAAGLSNTAYSDDAWASRVNISPQHVGRLRRVAQRFADKQQEYANLYWSHFNAVLDWDDAELWLEGAVQNNWSVAQMKVQRAEAVGASDDLKPNEADIYVGEVDDDSYFTADSVNRQTPAVIEERTSAIGAADITEGFDADNIVTLDTSDAKETKKRNPRQSANTPQLVDSLTTAEALSKLQCLQLPADCSEAFESMKLAVLNHKAANWKSVPPQELANGLDLLKSLVFAVDTRG